MKTEKNVVKMKSLAQLSSLLDEFVVVRNREAAVAEAAEGKPEPSKEDTARWLAKMDGAK